MISVPMTVALLNNTVPMSVSQTVQDLAVNIGVQYIVQPGVPYEGSYTVTPGTQDQTLQTDGKTLSDDVTVYGDSDLTAGNIVYGKTIFGVSGSARVPVVSQDGTTKVLTITG